MSGRPYNVLFLCTGNSARSILAESILNNLAVSKGRFKAYSAGSVPKGRVNPFAIELLARNRLPTEQLRSKGWEEFATDAAPPLDFVITVCDNAAGESCPVWPGQPMTAHWGVPDPAEAEGDDAKRRHAFMEAFTVLKRRIELFTSLPMDKLDRLALSEHVRAIGRE